MNENQNRSRKGIIRDVGQPPVPSARDLSNSEAGAVHRTSATMFSELVTW